MPQEWSLAVRRAARGRRCGRRGARRPRARARAGPAVLRTGVQPRRRPSAERRSRARARGYDAASRSSPSRCGRCARRRRSPSGRDELERSLSYWIRAKKIDPDDPEILLGIRPRLPEDGSARRRGAGADQGRRAEAGRIPLSVHAGRREGGKAPVRGGAALVERLVEKQPDDRSCNTRWDRCCITQGHLAEAKPRSAREPAARSPTSSRRTTTSRWSRGTRGETPRRSRCCSSCCSAIRITRRPTRRSGRSLMTAQRYEEAESNLRNAVRLDPKSVKANYQLGLLLGAHRKEGRGRRQLALRQDAARGGRGLVAPADAAVGSGPMTPWVRALRGMSPPAVVTVPIDVRLGPRRARPELTALLVLLLVAAGPARHGRAAARHRPAPKTGDRRQAAQELEKQLQKDPSNPKLHVLLGLAYMRQDDYPRALDAFQRAVEVAPASAEAHNWLGVALSEGGPAGRDRRTAEGRRSSIRSTAARTRISARRSSKSGDFGEAVAVFEKALALEPNSLAAHMNLGMALREKGEAREGARAPAHASPTRDPTNAGVQYELGQTLRQSGDLAGAIAAFEKAVELDPELREGYYGLGAGAEAAGRSRPRRRRVAPRRPTISCRRAQDAAARGDLAAARARADEALRRAAGARGGAQTHRVRARPAGGAAFGAAAPRARGCAPSRVGRRATTTSASALWYSGARERAIAELRAEREARSGGRRQLRVARHRAARAGRLRGRAGEPAARDCAAAADGRGLRRPRHHVSARGRAREGHRAVRGGFEPADAAVPAPD